MNKSDSPARTLLLARASAPAVSVYPDSNKIAVRPGVAPTSCCSCVIQPFRGHMARKAGTRPTKSRSAWFGSAISTASAACADGSAAAMQRVFGLQLARRDHVGRSLQGQSFAPSAHGAGARYGYPSSLGLEHSEDW